MLQIVSQCPTDIGLDRVHSGTRRLDNRIANANDIRVVPCPTGQDIRSSVSNQNIVERVSGTIDGKPSREGQIFKICPSV